MTSSKRLTVYIVDMGQPGEHLLKRHGSFSRLFVGAFEELGNKVEFRTCPAAKAEFDDLTAADGVILTGAEEGVYDKLPWRSHFDPIAERLIGRGKPILGVCFSHQYLSELLGGKVEHRPERGESGHITVELTKAGLGNPLFHGVSPKAGFLAAHNDMVIETAPGAKLLATNKRVPVQAFNWGENVWGVQFHPEFTPDISRTIISTTDGSKEEKEQMLQSLDNLQEGLRILDNFIKISASASTQRERP